MAKSFENKYAVFFEIYGKKMKTIIESFSEEEAKKIVQNKIIFHKVIKENSEYNDTIDQLNNMFK